MSKFAEALKAAHEAATPGPWFGGGHTSIWTKGISRDHFLNSAFEDEPPMGHVASVLNAEGERGDAIRRTETEATANLIVLLRNAAPELLGAIQALCEIEAEGLGSLGTSDRAWYGRTARRALHALNAKVQP